MIKLAVYLFISKPFTAVVLCSSEVPVKGTCEEYFLISKTMLQFSFQIEHLAIGITALQKITLSRPSG